MSNVDKRIVEMEFDNKQFEDGIKTSTKSLDGLKKSLELEGSSKGLSNLQKAANSFSLAGIASGVENLSSKFSALSVIGITALANLTNSALNASERFISALTIDPIKTGLDEYETKINAIQTILTNTASKGTTIDDVNKALAELNTYADQTIYDFSEMTRNIGTFTAAGVDLKTSVTSIKGIANLAAGSGSSAQQASTAMYQLSQAIASGSVKLQDWNSVVNAGMGGELFQKALEKTAVELGHGRNMAVSFRESLESGWITTEVLTKTLQKFANDPSLIKAATQVKTFTQLINTMKESVQSGWAQTWEILIGNKDEAAAFFTGLNDAFGSVTGASANARNEMLAFWKANEGRTMLLQGISNILLGISDLLKPIEDAFSEIFPPMTGKRLVEITKAFRDLTANFKIGTETATNIKLTFKGLFAVLDIGIKAFKFLADVVGLLAKALIPGSGSLLSVTASIGKFLVYLDDTISKSNIMGRALEKIGEVFAFVKDVISGGLTVIQPLISKITTVVSSLGNTFKEMVTGTTVFAATLTGTKDAFSNTTTESDKLGTSFDKLHAYISNLKTGMSNVAKTIIATLTPAFSFIKEKLGTISLQDIAALLTGGGLITIGKTLAKTLGGVASISESFSKVLDQVGNTLKAFQLKVKAQALVQVAIAIGILTASLIALSFIKMEDLAKSLGVITVVFGELIGALFLLNKAMGTIKTVKITTQIISIGVALLLLAESVKILSSINMSNLAQGTITLATLMGVIAAFINLTKAGNLAASAGGLAGFATGILILTGALAILGKLDTAQLIQGTIAIFALTDIIAAFINITKSGDLAKSAGGLIGFSLGIIILTGALAILGKLDTERITQGTVAIASLMAVIATFINVTKGGDLTKSASGLIGFSIGIAILSGSLVMLGKLEFNKLVQGGVAIALIMNVIAGFINLTKGGDLAKSAAGLIGFSIGLATLSVSLSILASLDASKIVQGVGAMATLMLLIATFINITKGGDLAKSAGGLIGFSTGLMILAGVLAILSALNTDKLIMASVALGMLIGVIAMFVNLTKGGDLAASAAGLIGFSIGIAILSGAMVILANVITILGSLDIPKLAIGIGALAAVMIILGLASPVLNSLTPVMLGLSTAIALFGVGCLAAGVGILAFSAGLSMLATIGKTGSGVLVTAIKSIIDMIPYVLAQIGKGIIEFAKAINGGAKTIAGAIGSVIMAIIDKIGELAPKILGSIFKLCTSILDTFIQYIPKLVDAGMKLITGLLKGVSDHVKEIVAVAIQLIVNFIEGITSMLPQIIQAGFDLVIAFINGLSDAIDNNSELIITAVGRLIKSIIKAAGEAAVECVDIGGYILKGIADGMEKFRSYVVDALFSLGTSMIKSAKDGIAGFFDIGVNIVQGLIDGINSFISHVADTAGNLAGSVLDAAKKALGIHSPSTMFKAIGENIVKGLSNGIDDNAKKAVTSSDNMSKDVTQASSGAIKASNDAAKEAFDKAVEWIDERKYYNQLSLAEELKAWQDLQSKYTQGSEERKKIDREVYRVQQELIKKEVDDKKKAFDDAVNYIDEEKYYNQLSLEQELALWEDIQNKYKDGTDEKIKANKEVYRIRHEMMKDDYDTYVKYIDDAKYYNQLSLDQELAAWEDIQNRYLEGSAEREKADREVYRVKQEMIQKESEDYQKLFDDAVALMDDKKYYNKLSLAEELTDWRKIQSLYVEGTEERKKADREVYRLEQEINSINEDYAKNKAEIEKQANQKREDLLDQYYAKTKEINDKLIQDIQNVNKQYQDAVDSRADSLYSSHGLFDKLETPEAVSGDELINNLQDQVTAFESWQKNINELTKKGIDDGLIKELTDMGPKSAAQIDALNNLSEDKLDTYVSLWKTKHEDAKTEAIGELESMRLETLSKIDELNTQAATELDNYRNTWNQQMVTLNAETANQLSSLQVEWAKKIGYLTTNAEIQVATMNNQIQASVEDMRTGTEQEVTTLADNIQKIMGDTDWYSVGANIIKGMTNGIRDKAYLLAQEAAAAALAALTAAKAALGINSPSKEFEKLGMYADQGFANGLSNFSNVIISSAKDVGSTAISALQSTISSISDVVNSNMDTSPVIRPVLDLSDIEKGGQQISSLFGQRQGINVSSITKKIPNVLQPTSTDVDNLQNGGASREGSSISFTQNNYSPTPLSRIEIYRQTKNQIATMKGMVTT